MSNEENGDIEQLDGVAGDLSNDVAYRRKRWKARKFAGRASRASLFQEDAPDGRAVSISNESTSSNNECKTNGNSWMSSVSVWTRSELEHAIECLVNQTPSYLTQFKETTQPDEIADSLPPNVLNAFTLSAALDGNMKMLSHLLERGADPNAADCERRCALHYAGCSFESEAADCAKKLIGRGAAVDVWDKNSTATPLICAASLGNLDLVKLLLDAGADIDAGLNKATSTALLWAVRTRNPTCVQVLIEAGATVNTYQVYSEAPVHVAAAQGDAECLKLLLNNKADVRVLLGQSRMSALHLAAEEGNAECIALLLGANADCNVPNSRGQSPLHLAIISHSIESITLLLKAGANPNAADGDLKSPLHNAVVKSSRSSDIVRLLIAAGAQINAQDSFGYTPLHLAAINENSKVAALLILSGADWSVKTKGGINAVSLLIRRTPDALKAIPRRFDSAINVADHDPLDPDCELHLDFRKLIPTNGCGEASLLMALVNGGQRQILQHPVVRAFLQVKWRKIRPLFIASLVFHVIFVCFVTAFIMSAFVIKGRECSSEENLTTTEKCLFSKWPNALVSAVQYANITLVLLSAVKEIFQLLQKPSEYIRHVENCTHFGLILAVISINLPPKWNLEHWQQHVAALVVVVAWAELMMHVGRFPGLGIYVQMFTTVATNIAKFLAAYVSLIIGFSFAFAVLYPDSRSSAKLPYSLVYTIVMMTGELDYSDMFGVSTLKYPVTSHVVFLLFLLFIVIVLMNLLVGLAVSDIQGLQKSARMNRLIREIELVAWMEGILFSFNSLSGRCRKQIAQTLGFVQRKILVVPPPYRQIYTMRPNDPRDDRFTVDIKESLLKTLMAKKSCQAGSDEANLFMRKSEAGLLDDKIDEMLETLTSILGEMKSIKKVTDERLSKLEDFLLSTKRLNI